MLDGYDKVVYRGLHLSEPVRRRNVAGALADPHDQLEGGETPGGRPTAVMLTSVERSAAFTAEGWRLFMFGAGHCCLRIDKIELEKDVARKVEVVVNG